MTPVQPISKIRSALTALREGIEELEATLLDWADDATEGSKTIAGTPARPDAPATATPPPPTFEEVRGTLAAYSKQGHAAHVKAALSALGVGRLSDVPSESFELLLADVEARIDNA